MGGGAGGKTVELRCQQHLERVHSITARERATTRAIHRFIKNVIIDEFRLQHRPRLYPSTDLYLDTH